MEDVEMGRVALHAIDAVLKRLGHPPLSQHPGFREDSGLPGSVAYVIRRPGAAPLRFTFGHQFDVALGPIPEVYVAAVPDQKRLESDIRRILTSRVLVDQQRRRVLVELVDPDGTVWLRSRRRAAWGRYDHEGAGLEPEYAPAFLS